MRILGIETSTTTGSIAVISERGVIAQYSLNIEVTHSERLMATVDRVLGDSGIPLADIDGFAVAIGPGSFTGLRIGISTVKGLSFATGKPVAAVPTLLALARKLPFAAHPVCPLLDARKNEVYAAVYRGNGEDMEVLMPESVITLKLLAGKVAGTILFTGEASHLYRAEIERIFAGRAVFAPLASILPSAAVVAEVGLGMITRGITTDIDALSPRYIRRPEAEVVWEKKHRSS